VRRGGRGRWNGKKWRWGSFRELYEGRQHIKKRENNTQGMRRAKRLPYRNNEGVWGGTDPPDAGSQRTPDGGKKD